MKKLVVMTVVAVIVVGLLINVRLYIINNRAKKNESTDETQKVEQVKEAEQPAITDVRPRKGSAVVLFLENRGMTKDLQRYSDELLDELGINVFPLDPEEKRSFYRRIKNNPQLRAAFQAAKDAKIITFPDHAPFAVGERYIDINIDATDQEIINFLLGEEEEK